MGASTEEGLKSELIVNAGSEQIEKELVAPCEEN
jgi:hypothetical protein